MSTQKIIVGDLSEYPLINRLRNDFNWDTVIACEILVTVMSDYKIVLSMDRFPGDFNEHIGNVIVEVLDNYGHCLDDHHLLYDMSESLLYICSKYHSLGIFKSDPKLEDWSYSVLIEENKIILLELI